MKELTRNETGQVAGGSIFLYFLEKLKQPPYLSDASIIEWIRKQN